MRHYSPHVEKSSGLSVAQLIFESALGILLPDLIEDPACESNVGI
jgi:hypothetical protein